MVITSYYGVNHGHKKKGARRTIIIYFFLWIFFISTINAGIDFIIFSFDRPIQLYALLESAAHYLTGMDSTIVIYRTSNEAFFEGYSHVAQAFSSVQFVHQGTGPQEGFKDQLLNAFHKGTSNYILFAPDDIIVKNYADMTLCTQALEQHDGYGFFLRLGTHLTTCYSSSLKQPLPFLSKLSNGIYSWTFQSSDPRLDWGYPNNVDMTIYRKHDIKQFFETASYKSPNTLEGAWALLYATVSHKRGLCFADSIIVNIPINSVQEDWENRHMKSWTTKELLEIFESGEKIDIWPLAGIKNESCHIEYAITFTSR